MPIARFEFPDGRIGRFEVPEGTTPEEAQSMINDHVYKSKPSKAFNSSPTERQDFVTNLRAGIGKGFNDTGLAFKQLFNIGNQDQLKSQIEENRRLEKPLLETGAGLTGNVIGGIASTAPAMFAPGANTIAGGAAIGGLMGLLSPSISDSEAMMNVGAGAGGGAGGVLAGRAIPAAWNAFVSPFYKKGQEKIAGNVLREAIDNDPAILSRLENPEIFVPGSTPSVAEVAMTPKASTLQKAVRNIPDAKGPIIDQEIKANGARLAAIRGIAKDDAAIDAAKAARDSASKPLYDAAKAQTVEGDDELISLLQRPSMQKSASNAENLAKEKGEQFVINNPEGDQYTGGGLHYLKMGLDDLLDSSSSTGIGNHERAAIADTKSNLLDWLDNKIPEYGQARKTYADMSKPINQMEVGQALKNKLVPALIEDGLPTREKASMFADAIRNQEALVKRTTGLRNKGLQDIMEPEQMQTINGILKDLERKANAGDLAATKGSDTASNLIANNLLKNIIGPIGMPDSWVGKAASNALISALPRRAVDFAVPGVERQVQGLLGEALADPKKAADILKGLPKDSPLIKWLYSLTGSAGAQGYLSAN